LRRGRFLDGIDAAEKKEELLASVAAEEVFLADGGFHRRRQLAQQPVAGFLPVAVIVVLEPVDVAHDDGEGPRLPPPFGCLLDLLNDLFEEGIGPEQTGEGVVLDEVQLRHGQGEMLGQAAEDLDVLGREDRRLGLLVVDFENADDLGAAFQGDADQAVEGGAQVPVAGGMPRIGARLGQGDLLPGPGRARGEIDGGKKGDVPGEIGMGEEGLIPNQRLEIGPERVAVLEKVEGDASGPDDLLDVGNRVEEVVYVRGRVQLAEDVLELAVEPLDADVTGLEGDPLLELLDESLGQGAADALDLGVDVAERLLGGCLGFGQGLHVFFQAGVFLGGVQNMLGPEPLGRRSGQQEIIDEPADGVFPDGVPEQIFPVSG